MNNSKLKQYVQLVQTANQNFNLTGLKTEGEIYEHLVQEIIELFNEYDSYFDHKKVADLGSGNGCPGVILKLLFPQIKTLDLIDSKHKKVNFLKEVIQTLQLNNTQALCARIENHTEQYDTLCSRGLGSIIEVNAFALKLLKPNGIIFHIKQSLDQYLEFEDSEQKDQFKPLFFKFFHGKRQQILIAMKKNV